MLFVYHEAVNTIDLLCNFIGTVAYGCNSKDMIFAAQNFLSDYKFGVILGRQVQLRMQHVCEVQKYVMRCVCFYGCYVLKI